MKKISLMIILAMAAISVMAQTPKWASKAQKSVFTLTTFKADGSLLATSNGFFIGQNGEALSSYTPFQGAASAVIVDASGKKHDVECMLGANETYDVAKFRVADVKSQPLKIAATKAADAATVYLLPYSIKKAETINGTVTKSETFNEQYKYYTIAASVPENNVSCPFLNDEGEVVGILQPAVGGKTGEAYAVSADFAADLKINGLSLNDPALRAIGIRKDLPDDPEQAAVTLFFSSGQGKEQYESVIEQYIAKFPDSPDGYVSRAQVEYSEDNFQAAKEDMEKAIKVSDKKDETHFQYSKLILQKNIYKADKPFDEWTLEKAVEEAEEAYKAKPQPTYIYQKAQLLYAMKKYDEALTEYEKLIGTNIKQADVYLEMAQCKSQLKKSDDEILALLDSAVNQYERPYLKDAATYLLARATQYENMKRYRDAVQDYNDYEKLLPTEVNDNFYYLREQAEMEAHLYQQALNDIDMAISKNPKEALYYAEKANLQMRFNMLDEAVTTCKQCIGLSPEYADAYLILGLIQVKQNNKTEGISNMEKAKQLGSTQAEALIEKYK